MFVFILMAAILAVVLALGGLLYADLSQRLSVIEAADDAPHNLLRQVEDTTVGVRDNDDELRRLRARVSDLESRKISVVEDTRGV